MAVFNVKDSNGKDISIDDSKVFSINGDISDAAAGIASFTDMDGESWHAHDVVYESQDGTVLDAEQILKDASSGKTEIIALDVYAESTHSGKNYNYCVYYEDSMEKDVDSFVNPYRKPMLKNHDQNYGDPIGRITKAWFGNSELTDERSAIHTVTRVTDREAIERFLDGRYQTVSIGGTIGTCTCNICGKNILKDGKFKWCGHWKGETYKDQVCYWGARDITYNEHSVVNNPADKFAQIVKVVVVTNSSEETDSQKGDTGGMDGENTNVSDNKQKRKQVFDMIDDLIKNSGNNTQDGQKNQDSQAQDSQTQTQDPAQQQDSQNSNTELEKKLKDAEEAKKKAEQDVADMKDKLAKAEKERDDALEDAESYKQKSIQLAGDYKSLVADHIIEKENVTDAEKEKRKQELVSMSMNELNAVNDSLRRQHQRVPGTAVNPTVPNGSEHNAPVGDSGSSAADSTDSKNKPISVEDYVARIINRKK